MPPRKMETPKSDTTDQTPPAKTQPEQPKATPTVKKGKQPTVSESIHGNKVYSY